MSKKPLRVWSGDRTKRHGIVSYSYTDLLEKASVKLNIPLSEMQVVLEEDGTTVDQDFWEMLQDQTRLIVLKTGESWTPSFLSPPQKADILIDVTDGQLDEKTIAEKHLLNLQHNPAMMVLLSMTDMEIIKDVNIDEISCSLLDKDCAKELQEQCINLYIQKKRDCDAVQFIDLLRDKSH